MIIENS